MNVSQPGCTAAQYNSQTTSEPTITLTAQIIRLSSSLTVRVLLVAKQNVKAETIMKLIDKENVIYSYFENQVSVKFQLQF